jgi:hypothetical protein
MSILRFEIGTWQVREILLFALSIILMIAVPVGFAALSAYIIHLFIPIYAAVIIAMILTFIVAQVWKHLTLWTIDYYFTKWINEELDELL